MTGKSCAALRLAGNNILVTVTYDASKDDKYFVFAYTRCQKKRQSTINIIKMIAPNLTSQGVPKIIVL
jgi:hypothetical protein